MLVPTCPCFNNFLITITCCNLNPESSVLPPHTNSSHDSLMLPFVTLFYSLIFVLLKFFVRRYPLLLNRLYKVTPYHHRDREALKAAQQKVELHLEHINQQTKSAPNKIWRRISNLSVANRRLPAVLEDIGNMKLRKACPHFDSFIQYKLFLSSSFLNQLFLIN